MKKILSIFILSIIVLSCTACSGGSILAEVSRNLTHYDITLDIDTANKSVTASQMVDYVNNTDSILTDVRFHLYARAFDKDVKNPPISKLQSAKAYPNGVDYGGIVIDCVKVANTEQIPVYSGEDNDILVVNVGKNLEPNERVNIFISYTIDIPNIYHRFGYGDNTINLGNIYPIVCMRDNGQWCQESYRSNGDPFYSDIANYSVTATYDKAYTLASTGAQKTTATANTKTTIATAKAVRDFAIVISDKFKVLSENVQGVDVMYYYFDDANAQDNLNTAIDALTCFSDKFYDYPYSTLSVVKADFVHGGMEYPNLVYIASDIEDKVQYQNVIIHEIAHQWWYGIVGNDEYHEAWLDEPLAEFSTALFYKWHKSYEVRYHDLISSAQDNMSLFLSVYREVLGDVDTSMTKALNEYDTDAEYTYMLYVKGLLFYDNLLSSIGEKKIVKALNTYAHNYAFKNATGEDLIATFEKSTGVKLNNFFDSWINGKVILN